MTIRPIRTDTDYRNALNKIESLMSAPANSPDGDLLEILTRLVEDYENRVYPIESPDPISAIRFYMEQNGLLPEDLECALDNKANAILNLTQPLTLSMIRNLNDQFGIPAESLIKRYGNFHDA